MAAVKMAMKVDAFMSNLEHDMIIDVEIGTEKKTRFKIQQSLLASISEYFVKAIKHQTLGNGQLGALEFPDDDPIAWTLLLWWKMNGRLPTDNRNIDKAELVPYTKAWILGDKYGITEFQNLVMFELLAYFEDGHATLDQVKTAFHNTTPGSPLRKLAAEGLAVLIRLESISLEQIHIVDGASGATTDVVKALNYYDKNQGLISEDRLDDLWKEFMVGKGPYCYCPNINCKLRTGDDD